MKTKPFNLAAAQAGAKLVTRDGRNATFIAHIPGLNRYPIVALIEGSDAVDSYSIGGSWRGADLHPEGEDLMIAVPTKTVYANLYSNGRWIAHDTEAEATQSVAISSAESLVAAIAVRIEIEVKE